MITIIAHCGSLWSRMGRRGGGGYRSVELSIINYQWNNSSFTSFIILLFVCRNISNISHISHKIIPIHYSHYIHIPSLKVDLTLLNEIWNRCHNHHNHHNHSSCQQPLP